MVDRTFNVSANDPEKQKRDNQKREAEQARKLEQIRDEKVKRHIHTLINQRDHAHEETKARDVERIERRIDTEIQKRVKPQPERHLRPEGMGGDTREQQVKTIRAEVHRNMGMPAEKRREVTRTLHNRAIEKKIDRTLSEQSLEKNSTDKSQSRSNAFSQNAQDIEKSRSNVWSDSSRSRHRSTWKKVARDTDRGRSS